MKAHKYLTKMMTRLTRGRKKHRSHKNPTDCENLKQMTDKTELVNSYLVLYMVGTKPSKKEGVHHVERPVKKMTPLIKIGPKP